MAVRSGRDFRSHSGKSRKKTRRPSLAGAATAFLARSPGFAVSAFLFVAATGAVAFNALSLQDAPHPAPLFVTNDRGPAVTLAAPPPPAAQRAAPPQAVPQALPQAAPQAPLSIADLVPPPPPSRPARETRRQVDDPIGALIRGEDVTATTGSIAAEPDRRLQSAQRALANLGYGPLAVDGLDGPMTRDAIRRFERDQGLAVTGALNAATARALVIRSGVTLD